MNDRTVTTRPPRIARSGIALLEVLLALGLFVGACGTIVGTMIISARTVHGMRISATAEDLAVTTLSEVQMGLLDAADTEPEPFEEPFEEYSWQIVTSQMGDVEVTASEMTTVEVVVTHDPTGREYRLAYLEPVPPAGGEYDHGNADYDDGGYAEGQP
ncbi:MAG: hypothetical protein ACLFV7_00570 [Phycisphaerae bacterium]